MPPPHTLPPYLFESTIKRSLEKAKSAAIKAKEDPETDRDVLAAEEVQKRFILATSELLRHYTRRAPHYEASDAIAADMALQMGEKVYSRVVAGAAPKITAAQHAGHFIKSWVQASDNTVKIRDYVLSELAHAHLCRLDIRRFEVLKAMYEMAAEVWSTYGDYSGARATQHESKR